MRTGLLLLLVSLAAFVCVAQAAPPATPPHGVVDLPAADAFQRPAPSRDVNDLSNGVFIAHYPPGLLYSSGIDGCATYASYLIASCDQENPRIDTPAGVIWYVLAAWYETDKICCGVEFGLGDYPPGSMAIAAHGQCPTSALSLPYGAWPGPNTGIALAAAGEPWSGNFQPVYWFGSYAYSAGQVPLTVHPGTGFGGFANCQTPPVSYPAVCFGSLGLFQAGAECCPFAPTMHVCCRAEICYLFYTEAECAQIGGVWHPELTNCEEHTCDLPHVCCLGETCQLLVELDCAAAGGAFHHDWDSCAPNPCRLPHVCCIGETCQLLLDDECAAAGGIFHPEWNGCGPPNPCHSPHVCCIGETCQLLLDDECAAAGGIFHPEWSSCDPPNPCSGSTDLSDGVLIAHYPPGLQYTTESIDWCVEYASQYPITSCDQENPRIDTELGVVWYVLAAWNESNKVYCGVEFGLGNYDPGSLAIAAHGACPTSTYTLPYGSWPGPDTGMSLAALSEPWSGNFQPVYWFGSYAYSAGQVPLTAHPGTGFGGFANCSTPPVSYPAVAFGSMGLFEPGVPVCPPLASLHPCCVGEDCHLGYTEEECQSLGGVFHPEWNSCGPPNPCYTPPTHVCCVGETCYLIGEDECATLGGVFHPEWSTCSPNPCYTPLPHVCCVGETCFLILQAECAGMGGTFHAGWYSCGPPNPCGPGSADLRHGVLIAHCPPGLQYTSDATDWCATYASYPITSCDQENPRIDTQLGVVWYVLAAWNASNNACCGVEFGLGNYDPGSLAIAAHGACPTSALTIPYGSWPGPDTGISLGASSEPWFGNFMPVYWFGSYAYSAGQVPLTANPGTGFGGFANCNTPPVSYPAVAFGSMGLFEPGVPACPPVASQHVCCVGEYCYLVYTAEECQSLGGVFHPEWDSCEGSPCYVAPVPAVCCVGEQCLIILESECETLGGIWHPEWNSCTPNLCAPHVCCLGDDCMLVLHAVCENAGGEWHPEWDSCTPNPCRYAACCTGSDCAITYQAECEALGGVWMPGHLTCLPNPCLPTLRVCPDGSGQFATIQAAVDAAVPTQGIVLCDGVYQGDGNRDVLINAKPLGIASESGNPEACRIECGGSAEAPHRGFDIHLSAGMQFKLAGITIQGGCVADSGGAIRCAGGVPAIVNCRIIGNRAASGGGIACDWTPSSAGDRRDPQPEISNCAITGNYATNDGGGVLLHFAPTCAITRCTFSGNLAGVLGGGLRVVFISATVTVSSSIFWQDCSYTNDEVNEMGTGPGIVFVNCDVPPDAVGGSGSVTWGEQNVNIDPWFCAPEPCDIAPTPLGDYRVSENSPLVTYADVHSLGLRGALEIGCEGRAAVRDEALREHGLWLAPSTPGPDGGVTRIRYAIAADLAGQSTALRIFDSSGRLVRLLEEIDRTAGLHEILWDGRDHHGQSLDGGVYFCRLEVGSSRVTSRLVLVR